MLIITRRVGEAIFINDDIKLVVLGVKRDQMRIGIEAPKEIPIDREELYIRKQRDKETRCVNDSRNDRNTSQAV
jgi:carbon storage regulator